MDKALGPALKHQGAVNGAQFSQDESCILTWSRDKTARLWDARTGKPLGPALEHEGEVRGAEFSRDESRILTWSDKTARLWDVRSGKPLGPALEHQGAVRGAQFSRDESRILTWSYDKTARLWLLDADLDFPDVQLWFHAITGSEYDFVERTTKVLNPDRWREIRQRYRQIAAEHARTCKYPEVNHWKRYEQPQRGNE